MNQTSGLTEEAIGELTSGKSFLRGKEYYRSGAIFDAWKQGDRLISYCHGSSESPYKVQAVLGEGKVLSAHCTCPYEWGGYCKHIVALLLTYVHQPDRFEEVLEIEALLEGFSREDLLSLLGRMAERDAELYDWIALYASTMLAASQESGEAVGGLSGSVEGGSAEAFAKARQLEGVYRRQVRRILEDLGEDDYSELYWFVTTDLMADLEKIAGLGLDSLESGAPAQALVALLALVEEVGGAYEYFDDGEGELGAFLESLDLPLAEAILSVEMPEEERQDLSEKLGEITDGLAEYDLTGYGAALAALDHGWQVVIPGILDLDEEEDGENWVRADWVDDTDVEEDDYDARLFEEAKLNVLERQGRVEDFLRLCEQTGRYLRKALKLVELGRVSEAVQTAEQRLFSPVDCDQLAQILVNLGHNDAANRIRERGSGGER